MPRPTDPRLIDDLTGLSNEWHFRILYDFAFAAADRGIPLTLVLFEIEGFDAYRRKNGSDRAAEALRAFGTLLAERTREMDVTARLHGSRFLSLLRDCNLQGGLVLVDRIQHGASSLEDEHGLTVAVGIAAYQKEMGRAADLLDAARRALARSAEAGGGGVSTSRDI